MKVENTVIYVGNENSRQTSEANVRQSEGRKNVFAGNFGKVIDPVEQKRQQAQKQAMKIVSDAWDSDREMEARLDEKRAQIREQRNIVRSSNAEIEQIETQREDMRRLYGVAEDSGEQRDLELLEKRMDQSKPWADIRLTDEEKEELARIDEQGLTEYQKNSLELYRNRSTYEKDRFRAQQSIQAGNVELAAMKNEMLKSQTMLKAQDAKEQVLEAASDEIVGMLVSQAKDNIDEEMEEKKEAAEEKAQEEEAREEQTEKLSEKEAQQEQVSEEIKETTRQTVEAQESMNDVQKEVQKIIDEMKLLDEDMKGAVVDTIS